MKPKKISSLFSVSLLCEVKRTLTSKYECIQYTLSLLREYVMKIEVIVHLVYYEPCIALASSEWLFSCYRILCVIDFFEIVLLLCCSWIDRNLSPVFATDPFTILQPWFYNQWFYNGLQPFRFSFHKINISLYSAVELYLL